MITPEQLQQLSDWLTEACEGVGEAFSLDARPIVPQHHHQFENLAMVGFAGDSLRGTLGVAADWRVLRHFLHSIEQPEVTDALMLDTLGEIGNQVLGRVKNLLGNHGVSVAITPPMVVRGLRLTIAGTHLDAFLRQDLDTASGPVSVWMDAKAVDTLVFQELAPEEKSSEEGDMMLFF